MFFLERIMQRAKEIIAILESLYPNAHCELNYEDDFQLLIAVILSAQCTDKRVNLVTEKLFKIASTPQDFASMEQSELEKHIFSCGFYKNKAKNIISASKEIIEKYDGKVPSDFDALVSLPGVGRKTANVVSSICFNSDGIAVDTHVFRTSNRLSLANGKTPYEVEMGLYKVIPKNERARVHHLLIFHGRYKCKSQSPDCEDCPLQKYCSYYQTKRGKENE